MPPKFDNIIHSAPRGAVHIYTRVHLVVVASLLIWLLMLESQSTHSAPTEITSPFFHDLSHCDNCNPTLCCEREMTNFWSIQDLAEMPLFVNLDNSSVWIYSEHPGEKERDIPHQ